MLELCSKAFFEQEIWVKSQVSNLAFSLSIFKLIKFHEDWLWKVSENV